MSQPPPPPPGQNPYNPYNNPQGGPYNPYAQQQPPQGSPYPQYPPYAGQPAYPAYPVPNPPPAPAAGGLTGGRLAALIAAVVVAVLVVAGGVWFVAFSGSRSNQAGGSGGSGGGIDAPHHAQGKLIWDKPSPSVPSSAGLKTAPGVWFQGNDVVRSTLSAVTAYNIDTGHEDWTVAIPSGSTCAASHDAVNNKIAVQYGTRCENVMLIDLSTHQRLWTKPLPSRTGGGSPVEYDYTQVAISGDVVALAWEDDSVAYQISTGKTLWQLQDGAQCTDKGFAGGTQLIDVIQCGFNGPYHVARLDPISGKAMWTWDAPAGTSVTNVLSVDPVVVGIAAGSDLITDAVAIDASGRTRSQFALDKSKFSIDCPANDLMPCSDVVVDSGTAYIATAPAQGNAADGGGQVNEVEAVDLASGRPKWVSRGDKERALKVFAESGNSLLAYMPVSYAHPGAIYRIDTATGAVTSYVQFSSSTQGEESKAYSIGTDMALYWYQEHFFMAPQKIYAGGTTPELIAAFH